MRGDPFDEREVEINPRPASYRVLEQLLRRGEAEAVARELGLTPQTVRNWCRPREREDPNGTGRHNPLDDLLALCRCWVARDGTWERPQRLTRWLAACCGGAFVPAPPDLFAPRQAPATELAEAVAHFAAVLAALSACLPTGGLPPTRPRAEREGAVAEAAAALVSRLLALQQGCRRW